MKNNKKYNIAVLDDHPLILKGLIDLLKKIDLIGEIHTFEVPELIINHLNNNTVDISIIDIRIFKSDAGLDVAKYIISKKNRVKVLIYSGNMDIAYIEECLKIGVDGIISKDSPIDEIKVAINNLINNEKYYSNDIKNLVEAININSEKTSIKEIRESILTAREIEILKLVCKGHDAKKIADMLSISVFTVRTHRNNIMIKTKTHNSRALYQYAIKNKLIIENFE